MAAVGISLRHSGHARVVASAGFRRDITALTGLTTKKKIAARIETNVMIALMKSP